MLIGELFAGIGGLGLGLERAIPGARIAWQVEQNPFCRHILERHWPNARRYDDVRTVTKEQLEAVDIIAAGFPCQGASVAGKRKGLTDDRTALWWQVIRIAGELRPRFLVLENVPGLFTVSGGRDFGAILGSMAQIGYDAEWTTISAAEFGAPHKRERLFIVGTSRHADDQGQPAGSIDAKTSELPESPGFGNAANATGVRMEQRQQLRSQKGGGKSAQSSARSGFKETTTIAVRPGNDRRADRVFPRQETRGQGKHAKASGGAENAGRHDWTRQAPSPFCGVDDGISRRMDRLRALGNAVVPQCSEWIGQRIAGAL